MAEPQTISRAAVLPVVATLSIASAVLALLVAIIAPGEFHHFEHEAERKGGSWPAFTENTKAVPFLGLVLVLPTVGFGAHLLRNSECPLTTLLWYGSIVIVAHLLWLVVSFLSVYILYVKFYHWL